MHVRTFISKSTDIFMHWPFMKQVAIVTTCILILEFLIMLLFHFLPEMPLVVTAVIDCLTLFLLLSPAIWLIIKMETRHKKKQKKARYLLLERDTRFYQLANSGQALIWTADLDRKFEYFNQPWLVFTGRTQQQEAGEGWLEGVHPDDLHSFEELYIRSFAHRKPFNAEYRLRQSGGNYRWIQNAGTPRYNRKGEFIGYIGHSLDITSRKESEAAREMIRDILHARNDTVHLHEFIKNITAILKKGTALDAISIRMNDENQDSTVKSYDFTLAGKNRTPFRNIKEWNNMHLCRLILSGKNKSSRLEFSTGGSWWTNNLSCLPRISACKKNCSYPECPCIDEGFESVALIPIRNKDVIFGLIQVSAFQKNKLSSVIIERLENIATYVASSILNKMDEYALKEKDKMIAEAQQIAHLGSWSLDLASNQLTWSDEVYRIFGFQPAEFPATYEAFIEGIHPEDRKKVNNEYRNSIEDEKDGYEIEHRVIQNQSGKIRYVVEKCKHVKNNSGKIVRSVGMVHDITERVQIENTLKENERLLRESQEVARIGSYSLELTDNTWKATNEVYKIFGIKKNHPRTLESWVNCLHPDYRKKLQDDLAISRKKAVEFTREYKIIRVDDNEERWLRGYGKLGFDSWRKPIRMIGTIQDITPQKLAEEEVQRLNQELEERIKERTSELMESYNALKKAEEKYRTIANYTFDWETWLTPEGKFIYVSPSCERITGYSAKEFKDRPRLFLEIVHPEDRKMVEHHFFEEHDVRDNGALFDFRIFKKNGNLSWISHSCATVYSQDGKWVGQRGSNRDITARKSMEENLRDSQKKLRALTQHMNDLMESEKKHIAREIHDELGHLLTVVKYDIENLIKSNELSVEQVKKELPVMQGMIESLIDSVRKIATELRPGVLDHLGLYPAIEWQINQFQMMTKIQCEYDSDEPDMKFSKQETTTIFRIFQEILTNIARHSKANKVSVSTGEKKNAFFLNVEDNGIGFDFNKKLKSSSLGLIGMQERALSIGAVIELTSSPDKGARISLLLER